jgi:hypothetical protein
MASSLRYSLQDFGLVLCEPLLYREYDGALYCLVAMNTDDLEPPSQIPLLRLRGYLLWLVSSLLSPVVTSSKRKRNRLDALLTVTYGVATQ